MENNKKCRILLIDDDEMNRIYFRDIFWIHGGLDSYDIFSTNSIREAEEIILQEETRPNVVFLDTLIAEKGQKNDVNSQIKRAHDFVVDIKSKKHLSDLKIVIYSSQRDRGIEKQFRKIGADGFLFKGELLPKEIIAFTNNIYEFNN
jgi:DNA-binding NarL/FixJ family response regulator